LIHTCIAVYLPLGKHRTNGEGENNSGTLVRSTPFQFPRQKPLLSEFSPVLPLLLPVAPALPVSESFGLVPRLGGYCRALAARASARVASVCLMVDVEGSFDRNRNGNGFAIALTDAGLKAPGRDGLYGLLVQPVAQAF
jgi:hypothetical protein